MKCPHCNCIVDLMPKKYSADRATYLAALKRFATPLGLTTDEAQQRRWPKALAARLFAYRELQAAGWGYARIGRAAGRDHATIMHALKGSKEHVAQDTF